MITQVFSSGNQQAVLIPKEFQLSAGDVEIIKQNNELIIRPLSNDLSEAFELLASLDMDGLEVEDIKSKKYCNYSV
jgi:virulence-associated protein VagC